MNTRLLNQVMVYETMKMGVKYEKVEEHDDGSVHAYISVPEHSYRIHPNGLELSGKLLAQRVKHCVQPWEAKSNIIYHYRVRSHEMWTEAMSKEVVAPYD